MKNDVIDLIKETITIDDIGQEIKTETVTQVFADVRSVTQAEFYRAGDLDLKPSLSFTIFFADYDNEKIVEYQNVRYSVYRTYRSNDNLELYVERRIGNE